MSLPSLTSDWNLIWFQRLKPSVTAINYANAIPQTWLKFNPRLTTATPLTDWNLVETTEILNKRHKLCYKGRTIKTTSISNTKFWRSFVSIVINFSCNLYNFTLLYVPKSNNANRQPSKFICQSSPTMFTQPNAFWIYLGLFGTFWDFGYFLVKYFFLINFFFVVLLLFVTFFLVVCASGISGYLNLHLALFGYF